MARLVEFPCGYEPLDMLMLETRWKDLDVKIYYKNSSLLMKLIYHVSFMWIWNRRFFDFHTTIGSNIYLVDDVIEMGYWKSIYGTVRHELIHVLQRARWWLLYDLSYLFPQILAPVAIFAIWGPLWLLFFLVFLAPLPAPWRMKWEMEGYTATLLTYFEIHGDLPDEFVDRKARNFYTAAYYFMWPFKKDVLRRLKRIATKIRAGYIKGIYINIYS